MCCYLCFAERIFVLFLFYRRMNAFWSADGPTGGGGGGGAIWR